ncbi:LysR family transcriptional regulator [Conservatibacter flavescens]|uniref:LysR family transcriptional regulator n=1 Tax=Conservatibacter flavescens TaxID=28161 RepID=A0A2M8S1C1_9PAST|nr:LysR family transcriptional regulator [Conservatibacter flavescens]PJG84951.1 LysR family transcriptional regulator [Conservatibacter flavescens]
MNFKQLRSFCAIVERKGLTAAAEVLFIAPTAISMQLLQLEAELGGLLFDRSKKPMELTALGRFFYPKAKGLVQEFQRLEREMKDLSAGKKEWLRVGFIRSVINSLLPKAIQEFKLKHPNAHLDLVEVLSEYQFESLRNDEIDIGISRFIGVHEIESKLLQHVLIKDPFVLAVSINDPLANRSSVSLSDLNNYPLVLYPKDDKSNFAQKMLSFFQQMQQDPYVAYEAVEIHTALALVGAGLGITLVGKSVAENNRQDVAFIPITDLSEGSSVIAFTREHESNYLVHDFLMILHDIASELSELQTPMNHVGDGD